MSQILRSIARSGAFKSIASPIQQSTGLRTIGARSLWHMSKPSVVSTKNKCTGFAGCQCGCGKRFSSSNGKIKSFSKEILWFFVKSSNIQFQGLTTHYITSIVFDSIHILELL